MPARDHLAARALPRPPRRARGTAACGCARSSACCGMPSASRPAPDGPTGTKPRTRQSTSVPPETTMAGSTNFWGANWSVMVKAPRLSAASRTSRSRSRRSAAVARGTARRDRSPPSRSSGSRRGRARTAAWRRRPGASPSSPSRRRRGRSAPPEPESPSSRWFPAPAAPCRWRAGAGRTPRSRVEHEPVEVPAGDLAPGCLEGVGPGAERDALGVGPAAGDLQACWSFSAAPTEPEILIQTGRPSMRSRSERQTEGIGPRRLGLEVHSREADLCDPDRHRDRLGRCTS